MSQKSTRSPAWIAFPVPAKSGKDPADRLLPPQAAGMSCYSVAEEIMPGRADFLVEQRGFELLTSPRCVRECLALAKEFEAQTAVSETSAGKTREYQSSLRGGD